MFLDILFYIVRYRCLVVFFFQAEDGIRDLVRSRGLGDVYKRQPPFAADWLPPGPYAVLLTATSRDDKLWDEASWKPVSYTHLTLPTSDLV